MWPWTMNNKEKIHLLLLCASLLVKHSEINDSSSSFSSNEDKQQQTIVAIHEATKWIKHNKSNHWYNNVVLRSIFESLEVLFNICVKS